MSIQTIISKIAKTESGFEMSSLDFLNEVINPARISAGENPIRPSDFNARINDEIDENLNYETFVVGKTGHKTHYTVLNQDQLLLVGMREGKAVRKVVLQVLNEMKEALQAVVTAETIDDAVDTVIEVMYSPLQGEIIKAIRERKSLNRLINKLFASHEDPTIAWGEFFDCYKLIVGKDHKEYRRKVINSLRTNIVSHNTGLRADYRKRSKFDIEMYSKFDKVQIIVLKIQAELRKRDATVATKEKQIIRAKAVKIGEIAKTVTHKLSKAECTIAKINEASPF